MDWDLFIKIASVIGAFGTVGGGFVAVYKAVRKIEKHYEKIQEHMLENYKSILQLKIMAPEMPLSERKAAADEYLSEKINGNGGVKAYCNEYLYPTWAKEQKERSAGRAEN